MLYHQYRCACCNRVVESSEKECGTCGSHNIRSPYGFWLFCILACLAAAVVFKVGACLFARSSRSARATIGA